MEPFIHNEDFEKQIGQILTGAAHVVDGVADAPEARRGHELALHQPPGGLLAKQKRGFQLSAISRVELAENPFTQIGMQFLNDHRDVVGIEILDRLGDLLRAQRFDDGGAGVVNEFGQHLARHHVRREAGERALLLAAQLFQHVSGVSRVKSLENLPQRIGVRRFQGVDDHRDEGVEINLVGRRVRAGLQLCDRIRHRRSPDKKEAQGLS